MQKKQKYVNRHVEAIGFSFDGDNTLFDLTKEAEAKGYDLHPVKDGEHVRACLFQFKKFKQEGKKKYKDWANCQYETLKIILKK